MTDIDFGNLDRYTRNKSEDGFECARCGAEYWQTEDNNVRDFCYCPDCGRKVI